MELQFTEECLPDSFRKRYTHQGDCWIWFGAINRYGYGYLYIPSNYQIAAHHFTFRCLVGPIPPGKVLHHTCQNKSCINPQHLEPVTQAVHNRIHSKLRQSATNVRVTTHKNRGIAKGWLTNWW